MAKKKPAKKVAKEPQLKPYRVEALERFIVRTVYEDVMACSKEDAEAQCRSGRVAYGEHHIEEGDDNWIETVSIEEQQYGPE